MTRDGLVKELEKAERRTNWSRGIAAALMLREAKNNLRLWDKAYAAGVAAEREKSLRLWMLLDDVDTADDIAKSDDAVYRSLCRQAHQKRWAVLTGDEVDATCLKRGGEE